MDKRNTSSSSSERQYQIEEEITTKITSLPLRSNDKLSIIRVNHEHEKRELSQLNDRFASYIERVRFLEAHNKKLQLEIENRRGKWGLQTNKLKEKYDIEIHQARHIIDNTAKDCATFNLRAKHAEEERLKLKDKYELILAGRDSNRIKFQLLEKQLLDNEADINLFHRRLIDLKDEQKNYNIKSTQLITDIQRITKDLDHEILTRIELENQKQTLEEKIHFLKEIHLEEIKELKEKHLISTTLDSTKFFQNQLSNAIKNIRQDFEKFNQQEKNKLQSWYQSKVTQTIQEIQSYQSIEKSRNICQEEEIKKLRTMSSNFQEESVIIREKNRELENRIRELEKLIEIERNNKIQTSNQLDEKIKNLRNYLEDLKRNYEELMSTKSSLDSEIAIYRKLLEGEEKKKGLRQIVENVEEQTRINSSIIDESTTYSQSYHRTTSNQEIEEQSLIDDNIRNKNERITSIIYEQPIQLLHYQSDSSDRNTDYDSSIEDSK